MHMNQEAQPFNLLKMQNVPPVARRRTTVCGDSPDAVAAPTGTTTAFAVAVAAAAAAASAPIAAARADAAEFVRPWG